MLECVSAHTRLVLMFMIVMCLPWHLSLPLRVVIKLDPVQMSVWFRKKNVCLVYIGQTLRLQCLLVSG